MDRRELTRRLVEIASDLASLAAAEKGGQKAQESERKGSDQQADRQSSDQVERK